MPNSVVVWGTHKTTFTELLSNNNTAGLFCGAHFDPDQMRRRNTTDEAFCIQYRKMFKTLIHLGFRTTVSNYIHGNVVKAMAFQGRRETTFCYNHALLYMNHIPHVLWQLLKQKECPFSVRGHGLVFFHCTRKVSFLLMINTDLQHSTKTWNQV